MPTFKIQGQIYHTYSKLGQRLSDQLLYLTEMVINTRNVIDSAQNIVPPGFRKSWS